ncbi:DoxX family protein [Mycolicibacterium thermoresistibile]
MPSLRSATGPPARTSGAPLTVSERTYRAVGVYMLFSAIVEARAPAFITRTRDTVGLPPRYRPVIAPIKAITGAGLVSAQRYPTLARSSAATLTLLFLLAVAAHIRVRDVSAAMCAAAVNAAVFATVWVHGPDAARH